LRKSDIWALKGYWLADEGQIFEVMPIEPPHAVLFISAVYLEETNLTAKRRALFAGILHYLRGIQKAHSFRRTKREK
jgi:hypothetical protein